MTVFTFTAMSTFIYNDGSKHVEAFDISAFTLPFAIGLAKDYIEDNCDGLSLHSVMVEGILLELSNLKRGKTICTPKQHLTMRNSESYCPACGDSKPVADDYCTDCASLADTIIILDADGWEPIPIDPYAYLDRLAGSDLISASRKLRTNFSLSEAEASTVIRQWCGA